MEPKANYILIGAFTIVVSLALFVFVVWLGKFAIERDFDYYDIVFEEAVTGLGQRGTVMFNGIQVGEVISLKVDPDDPSQVIARVRVSQDTPVRADTEASLALMGFTGQAYIDLRGGSPDSPILKTISERDVPVITAEVSNLQSLIASGGTVIANINDLVLRLNQIINDETMTSIQNTIFNIEAITGEVADKRENIGQFMVRVNAASKSLNQTMQRIETFSGEFLAWWREHGEPLGADLQQAGSDIRLTAAAARQLAEKLQALVQRNEESVDEFLSEGLVQVGPTLQDIRSLVQRLESLVRKFEENPADYLFTGEKIPEYQPTEP